MCEKPSIPTGVVGDSGLAESLIPSTSSTAHNDSSPPPRQDQGARAFSKIGDSVLYLKDSSKDSNQTEKESANAEDGKWESGVQPSNSKEHGSVNLTANSTMVCADQETSTNHHSQENVSELAWRDQIPTLDSFQPVPAPPPSMNESPNPESDDVSFTVGEPDAVPFEEQDTSSSSAMILQKPELPLTGDAKEDKQKILKLTADLRKSEAKQESLKKELEATLKEREEDKKRLQKAEEKLRRVQEENTLQLEAMQEKYKDEINTLKAKLADSEKQKSDQKEEYCKQIEALCAKLDKEKKKHQQEVVGLITEKFKLELKVEKMNTNEERLKRELSEANLNAERLRRELDQRKLKEVHQNEIAVLRSASAATIAEKDAQLEQQKTQLEEKDAQIQQHNATIDRLISQNSVGSNSSQGSSADSKI